MIQQALLKTQLRKFKIGWWRIDIDKVETDSVDLSKQSNAVNSNVKKNVYDQLVTKVDAIYTWKIVWKTQCNTW